nr:retrovirus-related Pol polyprotein from transposon opus [Tanacetum cinerariifolium]
EKCHFMVEEGMVFGYKVFEAGLEVDKAKIDVISKLPPPTNIKERRGTKNVAADHMSWIENKETSDDSKDDENLPGETRKEINTEGEPWPFMMNTEKSIGVLINSLKVFDDFLADDLVNLSGDNVFDFAIALRMFTRSLVIQKRVKDLQLAVESYQKKINVTRPETTKSRIKKRDPYTPYQDPQGFIYVDNNG